MERRICISFLTKTRNTNYTHPPFNIPACFQEKLFPQNRKRGFFKGGTAGGSPPMGSGLNIHFEQLQSFHFYKGA
jgi:hypothetical protein